MITGDIKSQIDRIWDSFRADALFVSLQHRAFSGDLVSAGRDQLTA